MGLTLSLSRDRLVTLMNTGARAWEERMFKRAGVGRAMGPHSSLLYYTVVSSNWWLATIHCIIFELIWKLSSNVIVSFSSVDPIFSLTLSLPPSLDNVRESVMPFSKEHLSTCWKESWTFGDIVLFWHSLASSNDVRHLSFFLPKQGIDFISSNFKAHLLLHSISQGSRCALESASGLQILPPPL